MEINELINKHMLNVKDTQMKREEYEYISNIVSNKNGNFLVFGTGGDSDIWRKSNKDGITFFLENKNEWIDESKNDIIKVKYTTKRKYNESISKYFEIKNF